MQDTTTTDIVRSLGQAFGEAFRLGAFDGAKASEFRVLDSGVLHFTLCFFSGGNRSLDPIKP